METRGKKPDTLDTYLRCAEHPIRLWCALFGQERREERTQALIVLEQLRESRHELITLRILVGTWEGMLPPVYCCRQRRRAENGTNATGDCPQG